MREIPLYPPIKDIVIEVSYTDRVGPCTKTFNNVTELAAFFRENPAIARAVGYVQKEKRNEVKHAPVLDPVRDVMMLFIRKNFVEKIEDSLALQLCIKVGLIERLSFGYCLTDQGAKYLQMIH